MPRFSPPPPIFQLPTGAFIYFTILKDQGVLCAALYFYCIGKKEIYNYPFVLYDE
ncbi:MAG: hypothetical protein BWY12_01082 [candidate division BRC1 bacterium ADurb.Bin183]|nr:MAG: hypothetical protein BWY12_01082 [candidate division BRC1 bacterium ADurb.Bin183]